MCVLALSQVGVYFTWDRIQLLKPSRVGGSDANSKGVAGSGRGDVGMLGAESVPGMICPGSDSKVEELVGRCERWLSSGELGSLGGRGGGREHDAVLASWLESAYGNAELGFLVEGPGRVNLTNCEHLRQALEESCAFDPAGVKAFTRELRVSKGWSIAFWVKPVGPESLSENGHFQPQLSFLHELSPPRAPLSMMLYSDYEHVQFHLRSSCSDHPSAYVFTGMDELSTTEWSFISFTVQGAYDDAGDASMTCSSGSRDTVGAISMCLPKFRFCLSEHEDAAFFNAIEVNQPLYMSPIMMIPEYRHLKELQEEYLQWHGDMLTRNGSATTARRRLATHVPVQKRDFQERSSLLAPSLIAQTRTGRTDQCPTNYSSTYITKQHGKAMTQKCALPFACPQVVLSNRTSIMGCPSEAQDGGDLFYFGLEPSESGRYRDFLYSLAQKGFLYRGGQVVPTSDFIDSATQTVEIVLVFFTPQSGLVTILNVSADLSGPSNIAVTTAVEHFGLLEGDNLRLYLVVQSLVLVNVSIMLFDAFRQFAKFVKAWQRGAHHLGSVAHALLVPAVDVFSAVLVLVYIVLVFRDVTGSAEQAANILDRLDSIPWSSATVELQSKKRDFELEMDKLIALISAERLRNSLCNVILMINLLRVIQCTSLHPRLALLTGTVANAADDLFHTALLTCTLMLCFAGIGNWRFGNRLKDFATVESALQLEFNMMVGGNFPENWASDTQLAREVQTWTVVYLMVLFLLVLNFLLAIIVEAYMKVREKAEMLQIEGYFHTDVCWSLTAFMLGCSKGWPKNQYLGLEIASWQSKIGVGYRELSSTGLFKSHDSVVSFLDFYGQYDFLEPPIVGRYGLQPPNSSEWTARGTLEGADSAHLLSLLDRRVRQVLQPECPPKSLRAELERAVREVMQRRRLRGDHAHARTLSKLLPASRPGCLGREGGDGGKYVETGGEGGREEEDIVGERGGVGCAGGGGTRAPERFLDDAGGELIITPCTAGGAPGAFKDGALRELTTTSATGGGGGGGGGGGTRDGGPRPGVMLSTLQAARCCPESEQPCKHLILSTTFLKLPETLTYATPETVILKPEALKPKRRALSLP